MAGANIKVTATGVEQIAGQFGKVDKSLARVGRTGRKVGSLLTRDLGNVSSKVAGLTSLLAGLGAAAKAKDILAFDDRLGILQAKMRASTTEMQGMKDQVLALGSAYGMQKNDILETIETYQDYGGLVRQGMPMLKTQTKLAKAYGASMKDLAKIDAVLIKQGLSVQDRTTALAKLTAQADAGTISLEGLAGVFPEIAGLGGAQGFGGLRGVDQLGLALQVAGEAFAGNADMARTSVQALLRDLTAGAGKLKSGLKVKVFDKKNNMRDLNVIMAEVAKATGGKMGGKKGLAKFFTADSQKIVAQWAAGLKSGTVAGVTKAGAGATAADIDEAVRKRQEGIAKTADQAAKALAKLDEAAQKHGATLLNFLAEDPKKTAVVAGGAYAAYKALPAVARFLMNRGKGSGKGGGIGGLGGLGVQHVWVDNMGGGLGGGAPGAPGGPTRPGANAATAGGVVAAAGVGWAVGTGIDAAVQELTGRGLSDRLAEQGQGTSYDMGQRVLAQASLAKGGAIQAMRDAENRARMLAGLAGRGLSAGGQKIDSAMIVRQMAEILKGEGGLDVKAMLPLLQKIADKELKVVVKPAGGLEKPEVQAGRGTQ